MSREKLQRGLGVALAASLLGLLWIPFHMEATGLVRVSSAIKSPPSAPDPSAPDPSAPDPSAAVTNRHLTAIAPAETTPPPAASPPVPSPHPPRTSASPPHVGDRVPIDSGPPHEGRRRVLYLTFDDGPSEYTPKVLAILHHYGDTATFFEIGRIVAKDDNAKYVPEVIADGNLIGNHTWSHVDLDRLSPARIHAQLSRTDTILRKAGAPTTRCVRPPYGANNHAVRHEVHRTGKLTVVWTIDTVDWKKPGALTIARRVIHHAKPGDIALLHDGGGDRRESVAAVKLIARHFHRAGWVLRALPYCQPS